MKKLFLLSYLCFSWILKVLLSRLLFFYRFCMIVGVMAQVLKEIISSQKFCMVSRPYRTTMSSSENNWND